MSDIYAEYVGCQTSRIQLKNHLFGDSSNEHKPWCPRDYTLWTPELESELLSFFEKLDYPFRNYEDIPFKDPLRSELRRFFISLDAYIESPNPVIPYRTILYGAAQFSFSEYLKRVKRKSFETTWKVEHFSFPDWWNEVPAYPIKDIGDIFNYSYLPFFKGASDDYLFGFLPTNIKSDRLKQFKDILRDLLPDRESFQMVDPMEVLTELSPSISLERGSFKHKPHYSIKSKYLNFSKERNICERSLIQVSPNNYRDSVLNDPGDLNTIKLLDRQIMEILRVMPGHIHLRNRAEIDRRYKRLYDKYRFFLHRDIKKEGITKPRELLKAILEVLKEVYPDIQIFEYTSFYDKFILRVDGELTYPTRGHGLGMANTLTTLMQLAVHALIMDELVNDIPLIESSELALNDDFVVGFRCLEHLEAYWDMEDEIMDALSIIRQPEKSFYSERKFVLAERYMTPQGEYEKISYQLRELLLPLCAVNVTHAKEYFIAAQTYVSSKLVPQYLGEISNYWGYEFYPTEFIYPAKVGGWINDKISSVDMTFTILDQLPLKSYVFRGMRASKRKLYRSRQGDLFNPPIQILTGFPNIPEEFRGAFDILPINQINDKYGRIHKGSTAAVNYWRKLHKVRQKEFKVPYDITYLELLDEIQQSYPTTQFYPADDMIECYESSNIFQIDIDDPYIDLNPKMALIAKYNPNISYIFREDFSIRFTDTDTFKRKSLELFSKSVQKTLKSEPLNALTTGRDSEFYYPTGDYNPAEQYLNPIRIGEVTAKLNWGKGFPKLRKGFESPLIESKKSIFGRLFTLEELILITRTSLSREALKGICDYISNHGGTIVGSIEYLEKYLKDLKKVQEPKVSEKQPTQDDKWISLERLVTGEGYLFWNWRQDQQGFTFDSKETETLLGILSMFVTTATYPGGALRHNAERIHAEILAGLHGPYIRYIAEDQGVFKLLDPQRENEDLWDSDEEPFGLFGTDDS